MLFERLPAGRHTWLRDPEGNADVQAYGTAHLPSQPVYVYYRPSVVKMFVRFTPRRIPPHGRRSCGRPPRRRGARSAPRE